MSMVGFPLLLIPLAIYNIIVFLMPGVSFTDPVLKVALLSGAEWPVTLSDMLLALAVLMLLSEVIKGARPGAKYLTDHLLSLIVFGGAAAEFLLWPRFGSSTFFLLTLLALVDFLSGLALRSRRRMAVTAAPAAVSRRGKQAPEVASPEPSFDPEPDSKPDPKPDPEPKSEPAAPAATSIAESVLRERPQSKAPQPEPVKPEASHPEVLPPEAVRPEAVHPPKSCRPKLRRTRHRRRSRPRDCSPAPARRRRPTSRRDADAPGRPNLSDVPGPEAGAQDRPPVRPISGLRIGGGRPPQAPGLRGMVGGRNQLRDKKRAGPGRRPSSS